MGHTSGDKSLPANLPKDTLNSQAVMFKEVSMIPIQGHGATGGLCG
jgi:hypothetical protein